MPGKDVRNGAMVKNRRKKKVKKALGIWISFVVGAASLAALFYILVFHVFLVGNIVVDSGGIYDNVDVAGISGIRSGERLYLIKKDEVLQNLKASLGYVKDVKLKRVPPDTVKLTIVMESARYYILLGDEYFVLSGEMKVLEKKQSLSEEESSVLVELRTGDISRCFVGENIQFYDSDTQSIIDDIYGNVVDDGIEDKIRVIDMSDKFDIVLYYKDRFEIKMGNFDKIEQKLLFAIKIIEQLYETDKGIIDVTNPREGSYIFESK